MLRQAMAEENSYVSQYVPVPRKDEMSEAHIEDYLDHFCAPLVGKVSYEERLKMREDLRAQFESVIAAHVELGSTRAQAIALTLQQFSHAPAVPPVAVAPPHNTGVQAVNSQQAAVTRPPQRALLLGASAFGLSVVLQLITMLSFERGGSAAGLFGLALLVSFPLAAGMLLGYRRPDRPLRSIFRSLCVLALPTFIMNCIAMSEAHSSAAYIGITVAVLGCNMLFGGVGAKFGTWMRRTGFLDKIDPPYPVRLDNGPHRLP